MKKWICLFLLMSASFAKGIDNKGRYYFDTYCSACHSLKYGAVETIHQPALSAIDAIHWFGRQPPDLSLITLKYSKSWLIDYLTGFYPDHLQRFGMNNKLMPNVAMPNVFASFGNNDKMRLEKIASEIADYLDLVAQPERNYRYRIGVFVLIGCVIAVILSAMLSMIYKK